MKYTQQNLDGGGKGGCCCQYSTNENPNILEYIKKYLNIFKYFQNAEKVVL